MKHVGENQGNIFGKCRGNIREMSEKTGTCRETGLKIPSTAGFNIPSTAGLNIPSTAGLNIQGYFPFGNFVGLPFGFGDVSLGFGGFSFGFCSFCGFGF